MAEGREWYSPNPVSWLSDKDEELIFGASERALAEGSFVEVRCHDGTELIVVSDTLIAELGREKEADEEAWKIIRNLDGRRTYVWRKPVDEWGAGKSSSEEWIA